MSIFTYNVQCANFDHWWAVHLNRLYQSIYPLREQEQNKELEEELIQLKIKGEIQTKLDIKSSLRVKLVSEWGKGLHMEMLRI